MRIKFKIDFSDEQIKKFADIISDIGLVILASIIIPGALSDYDLALLLFSVFSAFLFWFLSLILLK